MRFIVGFLSGILGALAGWFGLAMLVVSLAGPDRDGGIAMGAFFNIGPFGGFIGFVAGVLLFMKFGLVKRASVSSPGEESTEGTLVPVPVQGTIQETVHETVQETPQEMPHETVLPVTVPAQARTSRVFAIAVFTIVGGLAWWGWYELIRSPYLSHGFMTLDLQFRLPSGMPLPDNREDVRVTVQDGSHQEEATLGPAWHGTDGDHRVILVHKSISDKTSGRMVTLQLPGMTGQAWRLPLSSDPDPTPGFSNWQVSSPTAVPKIEMNFNLTAER
jgi:hypothetical protein